MSGSIIVPGVGDITDDVIAEFRRGWQQQAVEGAKLQASVAQSIHALGGPKIRPSKHARALAHITPEVYWHWVMREGRECWGDKGFIRDLLRDNPELRAPRARDESTVSFAQPGLS